jgi:FMN phosphatase YigB (HAD superfamily)
VLQQRGLLKHFGVVAISDELGMRKPDPAIFRWALEQAGTSPSHAVMVGDRRDNDIVPAGMLGMKTLWLCWRSHQDRTWRPEDPQQRLFLESCDRVAYFGRSDHLKPDPDGTVHDWASLPGAIADLVT